KMRVYTPQEQFHLCRSENRRRATSYEDRMHRAGRRFPDRHRHLSVERLQIFLNGLPLQNDGIEIAIVAFVRTKRNMNVDGFRACGSSVTHGASPLFVPHLYLFLNMSKAV